MTTYVFPGQGSQIKGMGAELFHEFPELVAKADNILGYSIQHLCLHDEQQQLNQTQFSQPALYTINALMYYEKIAVTGKKPEFVAGHSLGEYSALLAAEVFDFATGLKLVKKRGELMSRAEAGAMTAVIGLKAEQITDHLQRHSLHNVSIANNNSHTQIVISGKKQEVETANTIFTKAGASMVVPLKVSGAFHSPLMQSAQLEFTNFLRDFSFNSLALPVIANVSALPYVEHDIKNHLALQITQPVRWSQSIDYLLALGETEFEEIGPGKVLTGLIRRIKNGT